MPKTSVNTSGTAKPDGRTLRATDLVAVLRRESTGPEIGREPVTDADLSDLFSEMWLGDWLRRGLVETPFEELCVGVLPSDGGPGAGARGTFALEATDAQGRAARRACGLEVFEEVAARCSQRLVASGVLKPGDTYYYEVAVGERPAPQGSRAFRATVRRPPLACDAAPAGRLLAKARVVGDCGGGWMPVFFTRRALAAAERHSRRGAEARPPVETGCVLVGPLVSCPETGELAAVVVDALELVAAQGTCFSLSYEADTWRRLQAAVRARQAEPATRAHRILGQAHGHNFRPSLNAGEGENACHACPKLRTCRLTSAFVSRDDRAWSRAVFSRQPWQLALVYGHDARGENIHALFGLRENRLAERGYYVIEDYP